ncbi:hypothetical protein NDU88_001514 [Pleurodeles waltl]|uniref:Uncharacterized protein n=1 Tax=Pleurodeles waltl TaxID=8319 RepID=A0AAV7P607_PLEWA|nr:hypothetical protein NDU88_001514 [Pleurodeles waltl]
MTPRSFPGKREDAELTSRRAPTRQLLLRPCKQRMSAGRRLYAGEESGAANWSRAALELRRSRRAAARVSFRGLEAEAALVPAALQSPGNQHFWSLLSLWIRVNN